MAVIGAVAHQESPDMKVYTGDAAKAGKLIEAMFVDPFAVNNTDHAEKGKVYGLKFLILVSRSLDYRECTVTGYFLKLWME